MCDRNDSGAATWPGRSGPLLRLAAGYGERRDALEPLLRLVLNAAALITLLRHRSAGAGESGRAPAVPR